MATTKTIQPTNTTITMPGYTDNADVAVLSTDLSNITDAVNSLNGSLHKNIDVATKNDLETRILAVCDAMSDASTCTGYARINFTDPSIGLNGSPATVTYSRRGSGIYIVNILQAAGIMVSDYYYNNEHHWGSLKQDVDALNSNFNALQFEGDVNTLETGRVYTVVGATNTPTGSAYWIIDTITTGTHGTQYATNRNQAVNLWVRNKSNGTWRDWVEVTLMSTYNNTFQRLGTISSGSSSTFTVGTNTRAVLFMFGSAETRNGIISVYSTGTQTYAYKTDGVEGTPITITTSGNTVTIANSQGAGIALCALVFAGSVENATT